MRERITVVIRTFQPRTGDGKEKFDWQYFSKIVACQINKLLKLEAIGAVVVIVNGDRESPLSEIINDNGKTPSIIAIEKTFPKEIANGKIIAHLCENWGYSSALNEGVEIARNKFNANIVLTLSPEIEVDGLDLDKAIKFMRERNLYVLGFQKEGWQVPRNTIALWKVDTLERIGGFFLECDGIGKTVLIPKFGEVSLAGMEDFHAILRMLKAFPDFSWGMFGDKSNPLKWHTEFSPGSEREYRHLIKVARQERIMEEYSKWIFPNLSYKRIMEILFAHCCYSLDQ